MIQLYGIISYKLIYSLDIAIFLFIKRILKNELS